MDAVTTRSRETLIWSATVGALGASVLTVTAVVAGAALSVVGAFATAVFDAEPGSTDVGGPAAVAALVALVGSVALGWVLSAAPAGLLPRWLSGLVAGVLGTAAGAGVLAVTFGATPF